jgi:hypothetical protein
MDVMERLKVGDMVVLLDDVYRRVCVVDCVYEMGGEWFVNVKRVFDNGEVSKLVRKRSMDGVVKVEVELM